VDILKKEGGLPYGGVIHSFSGSADMVPVLEKLGASLSFSGSVTKKANKKAAKAVMAVSEERLLIETDSPDILPENCPEGLNEPAYLSVIAGAVACLRNEKPEHVAQIAYCNAMNLFGNG
jgi:TatD DNase family protein